MKLPAHVRQFLIRRYQSQRGSWLRLDTSQSTQWPVCVSLDPPTEKEAQQQLDGLRTWISAWRDAKKPGLTEWCERRWATLGTQTLPVRIILRNPEEVAVWAEDESRWLQARDRYRQLTAKWTTLASTLAKHFNVLADYKDEDFLRLVAVLSWLEANPKSNLYPRQLPIPGIDTKWLRGRSSLVAELFSASQCSQASSVDFFECCGLRDLPKLIRVVILDSKLREYTGGLRDITSPLEELSRLRVSPGTIYIVENVQTALAFGDLPQSIVIAGLGYDVHVLGQLHWLKGAECFYWGDLDTHGFAILNKARSYVPCLRSMLMDEVTLLHHQNLWVEEADQHSAAELPLLEPAERSLNLGLKNNLWSSNVRLEQERIGWDYAWSAIRPAGGTVKPTEIRGETEHFHSAEGMRNMAKR